MSVSQKRGWAHRRSGRGLERPRAVDDLRHARQLPSRGRQGEPAEGDQAAAKAQSAGALNRTQRRLPCPGTPPPWAGGVDQLSVPRGVRAVRRHARAVRSHRCANGLRNRCMDIKPIRTKADYRAALKQIDKLMLAERDTPEGERLDILVTLVEAYERKHFPMDLPDPVAAIRFRMEQSALSPKDLVPMIGRLNRVYEVLNRKRPLTLKMVWRLHRGLGIPAESLIKQDEGRRAA